jgi:hypothetical protein
VVGDLSEAQRRGWLRLRRNVRCIVHWARQFRFALGLRPRPTIVTLSPVAVRRDFTTATCTGSSFWLKRCRSHFNEAPLRMRLRCPYVQYLAFNPQLISRSNDKGQRNSSNPAPTIPPAGLRSLSTSNFIVMAAVCQPLAARPRNIVLRAASSSR